MLNELLGGLSEVAMRMRSAPPLYFALTLAACASGTEVAPGDAGALDASPGDASIDAGTADAGAPDAGAAPSPCPRAVDWALGPEFPEPRDHHATFVWTGASGPNLYVVGGFNGGVFTNAWRAPILAEGRLGPWVDAGRPNARTSGMALAEHGERIYLLGGHSGAMRLASSSSFTIDADGALTDTRAEPALPEPRFHASAAVQGDFVYVTGGLGAPGEAEASVFRARFGADGAIEGWQTLPALPQPRSHHSSFVQGGFLHLVGGFEGNPVGNRTTYHPNVIRAPIDEDGSLGGWEELGLTLPSGGVSTHANATFDGCALVFAGITDAPTAVSDATLRIDTLAPAAEVMATSAMPVPRSHVHHAPVHEGFVYLVSGKDTFRSNTPTVLIGRLQ